MKLKKFEAATEDEAMEMVKNELGSDALVLNIKKTQPKGLFGFFKKAMVEVTAAYDDRLSVKDPVEKEIKMETVIQDSTSGSDLEKEKLLMDQMIKNRKISEQQEKIEELQNMVYEMQQQFLAEKDMPGAKKYKNTILQTFYDAMISQGVLDDVADYALNDALTVEGVEAVDVNLAAKIVYNNIINMIGHPQIENKKAKKNAGIIVFMGPTGVGKTTTIAKMTSNYMLKDDLKVGLVTADTYRIAAVEQLKTYAEILDIDVNVVYEHTEVDDVLSKMRHLYDIICIDTAGRSHRNEQNLEELKVMLDEIGESDKYLVLSSTTKNEDLLSIINKYSDVANDFKLILTKLDETLNYGAILNVCHHTSKRVEYITNGQNVPDDIEELQPEIVAKSLLGLGGVD